MQKVKCLTVQSLLLILLWSIQIWAQTEPNRNLRLHRFESRIFLSNRMIRVLLPRGYDNVANRRRRYPVLYLNDGQNLFDVATSLFNPMEWRVDETVGDLIEKKEIRDLIVVGIDNAGRSGRANEYLPYPDKYLTPPLSNPQGGKYPDFLTNEVMPFIDTQYRTEKGMDSTGIGGSSYGALISLHTVIVKPGIFGRVLLESPSFYVSDAEILDQAAKARKLPERIYIGVGTNEGGQPNCIPGDLNKEAVQDVLRFQKILQARKYDERRLKVVVEQCALHNENAWARRFPNAVRFLFGDYSPN